MSIRQHGATKRELELVAKWIEDGGVLGPIDLIDADEFAREMLKMLGAKRNRDLRLVNVLRAYLSERKTKARLLKLAAGAR